MKIVVTKETKPGERRVALSPESAKRIIAKGQQIAVESGAGEEAGFGDEDYREAGATIETSADALLGSADLVVRVNAPTAEEIAKTKSGAGFVSLLFPLVNTDLVSAMNERSLTGIALDRVPRTTLAQSMDVLSSQSTVAGYRAVVAAAAELGKMCPLLMTAAGRSDPAKFVILGAGVAGLMAIGTARRMGAVVEAYDVRSVVAEQIESLGATFIDVGDIGDAEGRGGYAKEITPEQQEKINAVIATHLEDADVCITTALIPGRPAPKLLTESMVAAMKRGSIVLDMAAEQGGNCVLTKAGETVEANGVKIMGPLNLPSTVPHDASKMFSRNAEKLVTYILNKEGVMDYDFEKEIIKGCVVTHQGKTVDEQVAEIAAKS
jgi:NAD(P) transhydrogenase subunit alpha